MKYLLSISIIAYSAFLLTIFFPDFCHAEGVIGVDRFFKIEPVNFLLAKTREEVPYVSAFNFFFTLEIFVGLMALFIRWCTRVMRM